MATRRRRARSSDTERRPHVKIGPNGELVTWQTWKQQQTRERSARAARRAKNKQHAEKPTSNTALESVSKQIRTVRQELADSRSATNAARVLAEAHKASNPHAGTTCRVGRTGPTTRAMARASSLDVQQHARQHRVAVADSDMFAGMTMMLTGTDARNELGPSESERSGESQCQDNEVPKDNDIFAGMTIL